MPNYQYYLLLFDHIGLQLICLLLCAIPMYFIGKKYTHSWFDPLRISFIFVVFSNGVPLFLYYLGEMPAYLFYYFLLAEFLFWVGFVILAKKQINFSSKKLIGEKYVANKLFFIFFILFILNSVITYSLFGLPIFNESRISTYVGSGGLGILSRLNPFFSLYVLMYCYYQLDKNDSRFYKALSYFVFAVFAITGILSGSRGSFLIFLYAYFGYNFFYKKEIPNVRTLIKYFPFIFIGAITVLALTNGGNLIDTFGELLIRLTSSGDCYYMAYPNEIIRDVHVGNSWTFLFSNLLAPARVIDNAKLPAPIGAQLTGILFPKIDGLLVGPNSRPPIFGYVLFGWMGLLLSFVLGLFTSFLCFRISTMFPKGFISAFFVFYIYNNGIIFISDPTTGMASIFDTILNFCVILLFILIIYASSQMSRKAAAFHY